GEQRPEVGFVEAGIGCFDHRHAQPESGVARDLYAGNGQGFAEGGGWHQTQGGSRQDTEARLESHLLSPKKEPWKPRRHPPSGWRRTFEPWLRRKRGQRALQALQSG